LNLTAILVIFPSPLIQWYTHKIKKTIFLILLNHMVVTTVWQQEIILKIFFPSGKMFTFFKILIELKIKNIKGFVWIGTLQNRG